MFTGGPGQEAHLAPTYAAVNALCIIGTEEAYKVIDRFVLVIQIVHIFYNSVIIIRGSTSGSY